MAGTKIWVEAYGKIPNKNLYSVETIFEPLPKLKNIYWANIEKEQLNGYASPYHKHYLAVETNSLIGHTLNILILNSTQKTITIENHKIEEDLFFIEVNLNTDFIKKKRNNEGLFFARVWVDEPCKYTHIPRRSYESDLIPIHFKNAFFISDGHFARKTTDKNDKIIFQPLNEASLGDKVCIVAKIGMPTDAQHLHNYGRCVASIIDNGVYLSKEENTKEIEIETDDNKKVLVVRLNNYNHKTGIAWTEITLPNNIVEKKKKSILKRRVPHTFVSLEMRLHVGGYFPFASDTFYKEKGFKVVLEKHKEKSADIFFIIHETNGEIHYKINDTKRENVGYLLKDKTGEIFELGVFKLNKIEDKYGDPYLDKITPKEKFIYLVELGKTNDYFFYENKNKKFKYKVNTVRTFINDVALASLFGAFLELQFSDILINGFSHKDGSSNPSSSHKNGMNGDLRYLKKDFSETKTDLFSNDEKTGWISVDKDRQNQLNDALYKYGWKSMLSQYFNGTELFNHCVNDKDKNHNDHLHIQKFTPNLKIISNE